MISKRWDFMLMMYAVTFLLLLVSFLALYLTVRRPALWKSLLILLGLLVSAFPLAYAIYDDYTHDYVDANIGLGLAIMLTWWITAVIAIIALVKFIVNRRRNNTPSNPLDS